MKRLDKRDEVTGDELGSLVNQLIEGMLAVRARLAPVDRPGLVADFGSVQRNVLAVALHRQLLQIGGETLEILLVRQHGDGLGAEEIVVPEAQQAQQHRQVLVKWSG